MPPKGMHLSEDAKRKISLAKIKPKVRGICLVCGKEFERWPAEAKKGRVKYCSQDCYHKARVGMKVALGNRPTTSWNKGKKMPRDGVLKAASSRKGQKRTPEQCLNIANGKKGAKHPLFGKSIPKETRIKMVESQIGGFWYGNVRYYDGQVYCWKWNADLRERIRAFFNYTCQLCGHVWQPGERKLACHHVNYRKDSCCNPNVKPMFVALCSHGECHNKTNTKNREKWMKFFEEKIINEYSGESYLSKEEWAKQRSTHSKIRRV